MERMLAVTRFIRGIETELGLPHKSVGLDPAGAQERLNELKGAMDLNQSEIADLAASMPLSGKAAMKRMNSRITTLEHGLGLPHGSRIIDPAKAKARLAELEAIDLARHTPKPQAAAPVQVIASPAPAARQFKSSGDPTIDAAVREAGCWCLDHYKAKTTRDQLAALTATYREGSFAHQCAKANLAAAETELNRYL
jgi:hypothetical protein